MCHHKVLEHNEHGYIPMSIEIEKPLTTDGN